MRAALLVSMLCLLAPASRAQAPTVAAQVTQLLGEVIRLRGQLQQQAARELAEKALVLAAQLPPEDRAHRQALRATAELAEHASDHLTAEDRYARLLAIEEKRLGPNDHRLGHLCDRVGFQRWMRGDYDRAEPIFRRALEIFERVQGPDSDYFALQLGLQAAYRAVRHDYARAEEMQERALAILEKRHGPKHLQIANPVLQLAFLQWWRGDFTRAAQGFERVLALYRTSPVAAVEAVPAFLELLGKLHVAAGKKDVAESYYRKAEPIRALRLAAAERRFGPTAWEISTPLFGLAGHYNQRRQTAKARPLFERLLLIYENKFGKDHLGVRAPLLALAKIAERERRLDDAVKLYERALVIEDLTLLAGQVRTAELLLARVRRLQGRFAESAALQRKILAGWERSYGPKSRPVGTTLQVLGLLAWAQRDTTAALSLLGRAEEILETHLAIALATGTEKDRRKFIAELSHTLDGAVTFHLVGAPASAEAAALALTTVLRRKGRVLDAASGASSLRNRLAPAARTLFDELVGKRAQLAKLALQGPGREPEAHLRRVAALEDEARKLEIQLSTASAAFRVRAQPVTLAAVRERIPKDAALVEYVLHHRVDPKVDNEDGIPASSRRYAAYVLRSEGPIRFVDLGLAEPVDRTAGRLRARLSSPQLLDARALARRLDEQVLRPVRVLVPDAKHLLVSPDGALSLVPFGALVGEDGKYALQRTNLTYLTAGRDLLRVGIRAAPRQPPVIVADPDFTGKGQAAPDGGAAPAPAPQRRTRGRRSMAFGEMRWAPLPASAEEATKVKDLLADAVVFAGADATEAVLKALQAPKILHVATHGFFLPDQPTEDPAAHVENPLLRAGLVLSGANDRHSGEEDDGVLTALEASTLDLWGTRLVVLSACETGVGEVQVGEGVQGLRRAFVLAGAESQLSSLWRVDDEATRDLMIGYYKRLQAGAGRSEALRETQLALAADPKRAHPFFWAAFVPSGDWTPLSQ